MRFLHSRFVIVPAALAIAIAAWNLYVARHDHGTLAGRVVDARGAPMTGATVILYEQQFTNQIERARTRTGPDGSFSFAGNRSHLVQVQAQAGDRASSRRTIRLWFRAQDRTLAQPLIVR